MKFNTIQIIGMLSLRPKAMQTISNKLEAKTRQINEKIQENKLLNIVDRTSKLSQTFN